MYDDRVPITEDELTTRLTKEIADLSENSRQRFSSTSIKPRLATVRGSDEHRDENVWVVAQAGDCVIFFDDDEDEFAVGRVDQENHLLDFGLMGDLTDALHGFPEALRGPGAG
jgi:hypothetical protein